MIRKNWMKKFLLLTCLLATMFVSTTVYAEIKTFSDGEIVTNLTTEPNGIVTMHAIWDVTPITLQTPTKPGYIFEGWYADSTCTEYIGDAGDLYTPTAATVVLYAKWIPKIYTVIFDLNDNYTETAKFALHDATCETLSKNVTFDEAYGELPVPVRSGYTFLGWYTTETEGSGKKANEGTQVIATSRFSNLNTDGTDGADQILYARWQNNNPTNVKIIATATSESRGVVNYRTGESDVTSVWIDAPFDFTVNANDVGDGIDTISIDVTSNTTDSENPAGFFGAVQIFNKDENVNADFGLFETEGTSTFTAYVGDIESTQSNRILTGQSTTNKLTLKIDTTKPLVNQFDITVGTNATPLNFNNDKSFAGKNVYNAMSYGSEIKIDVTDRNATLSDETDVSMIRYMYLRIYDTNNYDATSPETLANSYYRDYELMVNNPNGQLDADYEGIINTNVDFCDILNLSYELHVLDVAGNETIVTKQYNRIPEIYATIENVTAPGENFLSGYRGKLHIFTTGWVDDLALIWPECITKSAIYDKEHDEEWMEYNVTINMENIATYALRSIGDPNLIYLDADGENTGFVRCYTFDFWIPLYLMHENNPDRLIIPEDGGVTLPIISVARKYIYQTTGEQTVVTVYSPLFSALFTIGKGTIIDEIRTSILN